jgi:hypothetical protein
MNKYDLSIILTESLKPILNTGLKIEFNFYDDRYFLGVKGTNQSIYYPHEVCILCYNHKIDCHVLNELIYNYFEHDIKTNLRNDKINLLLND